VASRELRRYGEKYCEVIRRSFEENIYMQAWIVRRMLHWRITGVDTRNDTQCGLKLYAVVKSSRDCALLLLCETWI
jgi:hypothetical protein